MNVITVEDPVEYRIPGINQVQTNAKAGLTFASALRSILRSDPDVVLIGEIRDHETAQIAIEAALTGHLVLSTLHTNDAPSADHPADRDGHRALPRRLRARLRPRPAARAPAVHEVQGGVHADAGGARSPARYPVAARTSRCRRCTAPIGCSACSKTGYKGRLALHEVMVVTEEIERLAVERASAETIGKVARDEGMITLRHDGMAKVARGRHLARGDPPRRRLTERTLRSRSCVRRSPQGARLAADVPSSSSGDPADAVVSERNRHCHRPCGGSGLVETNAFDDFYSPAASARSASAPSRARRRRRRPYPAWQRAAAAATSPLRPVVVARRRRARARRCRADAARARGRAARAVAAPPAGRHRRSPRPADPALRRRGRPLSPRPLAVAPLRPLPLRGCRRAARPPSLPTSAGDGDAGRAARRAAPARRPGERRAFEARSCTDLLIHVLESGASDLHLTAGARPIVPHARSPRADRGRSPS